MAITYLSGNRIQGSSTSPNTASAGTVSSNITLNFNATGTFTPTSNTTVQYLSGGRIQGRSDDSVAGADEEIILDDNPSSQFSWGTGIGDYAPTTPSPSNHNNYNGVFINTNSVLKGKTLKKIKAWLCKFGSPNTSGTIRLGVMSGTGSGSTITWVTDAYVDIENLISGESGGVTLNTGFPATAVPIEITLPTAHVLAENDTIALGLTGGNYGSGTNVGWQYSDGTGMYDGSNTSRNRFSNGAWTGSGMTSDMHTTITVAGTTAKDKSSITNVPAGTRYEEVDTRKIFRRKHTDASTVWSQLTSNDHAQVNNTNTSEDIMMGQEFQSGHVNIGKTFDKVTVRLRNLFSSSATYAITMKVWNSGSGNTVKATSPTVVTLADLETAWDSSSPYDDAVVYTFTTPVTLVAGDIIGVEPQGGTFSSSSVGYRQTTSDTESNTRMNSYRSAWGGNTGFYTDESYMILELQASDSWVEKGTA